MENSTLADLANVPSSSEYFSSEDIGGHSIRFRKLDAFGSLTDLCHIYGKRPAALFQLPGIKHFMKDLASSLGQGYENLTSVQSNGLYRGTWVHPLLLVEIARRFDAKFGIACSLAILNLLSKKGKTLANGDVVLPMNAEALNEALEVKETPVLTITTDQFQQFQSQIEQLQNQIVDMRSQIVFLKGARQLHSAAIRKLFMMTIENGQSASRTLKNIDRAFALPAPEMAPLPPVLSPAPGVDPDIFNPQRPSLQRMRELVGQRIRGYGKIQGMTYSAAWRRLYDWFKETTGFDADRHPKGKTRIGYVEAEGKLPELFELSARLIA
jgi:hypothetical protein